MTQRRWKSKACYFVRMLTLHWLRFLFSIHLPVGIATVLWRSCRQLRKTWIYHNSDIRYSTFSVKWFFCFGNVHVFKFMSWKDKNSIFLFLRRNIIKITTFSSSESSEIWRDCRVVVILMQPWPLPRAFWIALQCNVRRFNDDRFDDM